MTTVDDLVDEHVPVVPAPLGTPREPDEVLHAIRTAATSGEVGEIVAQAWAHAAPAADTPERRSGDGLERVLAPLRELERAAQERRDRQHQAVLDVLRELAEHGTNRGLLDATPEALRRLGFESSSLAWLDGDGPESGRAGAAADPVSRRLGPGESEVVRRRSAVLVPRDTAADPPGRASVAGHVAVPVVVGTCVAGVLRAAAGRLDETDRQVVATFADGLGHLIRWNRAHEEFAALQAALSDVIDRTRPAGGAASPPAPRRTDPSPGGPLSSLTPREVEIMGHLAAGDTNARIARRLVITEGTVKSHVKSLLRKLGAANRAEAVSIWHRSQMSARGGRHP